MARPVNANADETKARIVGVAKELFAKHGLEGASVRQIAGAAGVSLGTVNLHFGSKRGLYDACMQSLYMSLFDVQKEMLAALTSGQSPTRVAVMAVRGSYRSLRRHPLTARLWLRELVSEGGVVGKSRADFQKPFIDMGTKLLGELLDRSPSSLRLPLQTVMATIFRYALSSDDEICFLLERDAMGPDAIDAIEHHLVVHACQAFEVPPPTAADLRK